MTADDGAIGRAQVYGNALNPLQYYIQTQAQNRQYQQQQQAQQLKRRDDLIKELRQFNPDKVWEPFYDEVNRDVQSKLRDPVNNMLAAGIPAQQVEPEAQKIQGDINTKIAKINWLKQRYTDIGKRIDDDDYLNPDYYHSRLNDKIFNGAIARRSDEINLNETEQTLFRDTKGYKVNRIVTDFMKDLPKLVNQYYQEQFGQYGKTYDITETETKLGHEYTIGRDGKRKIVLDPNTLLPKINMTDDVYAQAAGNEYLMNIVHDGLQDAGIKDDVANQKAFLTKLLAGQDPNQIKYDIRLGFKKPDSDVRTKIFGGYGYQTPVDDLEGRDKLLQRIVTSRAGDDGGDDLLSYFNNIGKDYKAEYTVDKGKRAVTIHYPGLNSDMQVPTVEELQAMDPVKATAVMEEIRKNRVMKHKTFPLSTEAEQRAAKVFLSERMDETDPKRSIGQEYLTYINEKRDVASRKKGASGVKWK